METYLFTWNPTKPNSFRHFADSVRAVRRGETVDQEWSNGNTRRIPVGARFFFHRQGANPKGIIGSGQVVEADHLGPDWNGPGLKHYNTLRFDVLLDPATEPILTTRELLKIHDKPGFWNIP